MYITFKYRTR